LYFGYDKVSSRFRGPVSQIAILATSIYFIWLIYAMISAFRSADVTELYKVSAYLVTVWASLLIVLATLYCEFKLERIRNTGCRFLVVICVENLFVFVMTKFHWPYEVLADQEYLDPSEGVQNGGFLSESDV
jgi:ABC-type xylose transport system permease subunit